MENRHFEYKFKEALKKLNDIELALNESSIVAITDSRGFINHVNDKFCEISKYERHELLGQDHRIINSKHHSSLFFKELWSTISSGNMARRNKKQGKRRLVLLGGYNHCSFFR